MQSSLPGESDPMVTVCTVPSATSRCAVKSPSTDLKSQRICTTQPGQKGKQIISHQLEVFFFFRTA